MAGHKFHHTVLREYDIRATVGQTLSALDAHAIGRAFGTLVVREGKGPKVVCVGYDGRLSSPELEAGLVRGLTESGVDVVRIGLEVTVDSDADEPLRESVGGGAQGADAVGARGVGDRRCL